MQEGTGNLLCSDGICIADWRGEFCPKCQISSFRAKLFLFYTSAENDHLGNIELKSLKVKKTSNCPAILPSNLKILFSKLFFKNIFVPTHVSKTSSGDTGHIYLFCCQFSKRLGKLDLMHRDNSSLLM